MPIYMIQAGGEWGPVKIGHGDPIARLNDCQVGNHLELRIIRTFEGGILYEAFLHARFAPLWIRGEWHNFSREMLGDVGLVEIIPPAPESSAPHGPGDISLLRQGRGSLAKLSDALGLTRAAVAKWSQVPASRVLKVAELTGLSRHVLRPDLYPDPEAE